MDTDPAWIKELLKSNYPPSNEEAQEIKELLRKPLQHLEHRSPYESVLAPIRRVPADVLLEIFGSCLPTHRNPIIKSSDCPLLLTHICRTWRETAISTPKLWDRLHITFTDGNTLPDIETTAGMAIHGKAPTKAEKERTTELLRQRFEAVKEWFLRSGTRDLSISMNISTAQWYTVPHSERPPSLTMEFLSFLASLAPRWKEFEVKASDSLCNALENMLPETSQMKSLTCFRAKAPSQTFQTQHINLNLKLFDAPNLRQISLGAGYAQAWLDISRQTSGFRVGKWDNLTDISCFYGFSFTETASLLKSAADLQVVHYRGEIKRDKSPVEVTGPILLPSLQSLCIHDRNSPKLSYYFYDKIVAPNLHSFKYFNTFDHQNPGSTNSDFCILPLIRKSIELRNLSVDAKVMSELNLKSLLHAAPSVTNLTIGEDGRLPDRITMGRGSSFPKTEISYLTVENSSNSKDVLLPLLESLIIARRDNSLWISDDELFDVIKSRITSTKTEVLRHVRAYLYRKGERDIAEELARYAERFDVQIDLEVKYAPTQLECAPAIQTGFSPDFGLRKDGRSWPDVEAGYFL